MVKRRIRIKRVANPGRMKRNKSVIKFSLVLFGQLYIYKRYRM